MKKWLALGLGALLIVTVGCGGNKTTETAQTSQKILKVGTNPDFAPFEFIDGNGQMAGFDLDLIHAIGKKIGVKIRTAGVISIKIPIINKRILMINKMVIKLSEILISRSLIIYGISALVIIQDIETDTPTRKSTIDVVITASKIIRGRSFNLISR